MGDGSENYSSDEEEKNELPQIPSLNLAGPQEVNVDNSQVKIGNTVNVNLSVGNIVMKSERPDQLLQVCSTNLPGNDLKQIIGEIVAQTIPRYLQDKSLVALKYNENCTHDDNQNFQQEDNKLKSSESNRLVTYEKSTSLASSHEYNIQEIDNSKSSKQTEERSKSSMKEFRKPMILWATPEGYESDESSPTVPCSCPSSLTECHNSKINCFESQIRKIDELSSGNKQAVEPHACSHFKPKQLPSLSSSVLPENNQSKVNYNESEIRETEIKANCSQQIIDTSNDEQLCKQTCFHKQCNTPHLYATSSKHGGDIKESNSKQSGFSNVFPPVEHKPNASTSQNLDSTMLVKSLSSIELQNLIINTFAKEVCIHFKTDMLPFELGDIKENFHIFVTYIIKVFEVTCMGGKLRSVDHVEMTRVTDFEMDNHGLSFNIEFNLNELIVSFDNCYLHFLPILKVMFPGFYRDYKPVEKKLEIIIKECLIKTHFIINISEEIRKVLDTNVYFLDDLVIKITSEDFDSNPENKIGEEYFANNLQKNFSKLLKRYLIVIFNSSANYVANVNETFCDIIQNVFK